MVHSYIIISQYVTVDICFGSGDICIYIHIDAHVWAYVYIDILLWTWTIMTKVRRIIFTSVLPYQIIISMNTGDYFQQEMTLWDNGKLIVQKTRTHLGATGPKSNSGYLGRRADSVKRNRSVTHQLMTKWHWYILMFGFGTLIVFDSHFNYFCRLNLAENWFETTIHVYILVPREMNNNEG